MVLEPLLTAVDLSRLLGLSEKTINTQASQRPDRLPPRVASMRVLRWSPDVVRRWIDEQSQRPDTPRKGRRRTPT